MSEKAKTAGLWCLIGALGVAAVGGIGAAALMHRRLMRCEQLLTAMRQPPPAKVAEARPGRTSRKKAEEPAKRGGDGAPAQSAAAFASAAADAAAKVEKLAQAAEPAAKPESGATEDGHEKYTVRDGDDIVSIAIAFSVSPSVICDLNGLSPQDSLKVGDVIKLPKGATVGGTSEAEGEKVVEIEVKDVVYKGDDEICIYFTEMPDTSLRLLRGRLRGEAPQGEGARRLPLPHQHHAARARGPSRRQGQGGREGQACAAREGLREDVAAQGRARARQLRRSGALSAARRRQDARGRQHQRREGALRRGRHPPREHRADARPRERQVRRLPLLHRQRRKRERLARHGEHSRQAGGMGHRDQRRREHARRDAIRPAHASRRRVQRRVPRRRALRRQGPRGRALVVERPARRQVESQPLPPRLRDRHRPDRAPRGRPRDRLGHVPHDRRAGHELRHRRLWLQQPPHRLRPHGRHRPLRPALQRPRRAVRGYRPDGRRHGHLVRLPARQAEHRRDARRRSARGVSAPQGRHGVPLDRARHLPSRRVHLRARDSAQRQERGPQAVPRRVPSARPQQREGRAAQDRDERRARRGVVRIVLRARRAPQRTLEDRGGAARTGRPRAHLRQRDGVHRGVRPAADPRQR